MIAQALAIPTSEHPISQAILQSVLFWKLLLLRWSAVSEKEAKLSQLVSVGVMRLVAALVPLLRRTLPA